MAIATFDYSGQVVLVTGGTKGLGRGIAGRFHDAGATVVVCARKEPEAALPEGMHFLPVDLTDGDAAWAMVDAVVQQHGRLDVAVNNAGGSPATDTTTASPRFTAKIVTLNLLTAIYVAQRANHHMQAGDGGAIINIGSVVAHRPAPGTAAYGAAKAGLYNFTRTVGQEWAPKVRTNFVTVGMVRTETASYTYGDDAAIARVEATIPVGRLVLPDDVANTCLFLGSQAAAYITGADIVMDGGGDRPTWMDAVGG